MVGQRDRVVSSDGSYSLLLAFAYTWLHSVLWSCWSSIPLFNARVTSSCIWFYNLQLFQSICREISRVHNNELLVIVISSAYTTILEPRCWSAKSSKKGTREALAQTLEVLQKEKVEVCKKHHFTTRFLPQR